MSENLCEIGKCFKLLAHGRTAMTLTSPLLCMRPGFKPLLTSSPLLHTLPPFSFEFQTHFLLFSQQSPTIDSQVWLQSIIQRIPYLYQTVYYIESQISYILFARLQDRTLMALEECSIKLHNMSAMHKASIKFEEN
jgi:hypothetical protein